MLTEAGHALLPRARQIVTDVTDFGLLARGIAQKPELLRDHLQLVLSSRTSLQKGRDFGVLAVNRW